MLSALLAAQQGLVPAAACPHVGRNTTKTRACKLHTTENARSSFSYIDLSWCVSGDRLMQHASARITGAFVNITQRQTKVRLPSGQRSIQKNSRLKPWLRLLFGRGSKPWVPVEIYFSLSSIRDLPDSVWTVWISPKSGEHVDRLWTANSDAHKRPTFNRPAAHTPPGHLGCQSQSQIWIDHQKQPLSEGLPIPPLCYKGLGRQDPIR